MITKEPRKGWPSLKMSLLSFWHEWGHHHHLGLESGWREVFRRGGYQVSNPAGGRQRGWLLTCAAISLMMVLPALEPWTVPPSLASLGRSPQPTVRWYLQHSSTLIFIVYVCKILMLPIWLSFLSLAVSVLPKNRGLIWLLVDTLYAIFLGVLRVICTH